MLAIVFITYQVYYWNNPGQMTVNTNCTMILVHEIVDLITIIITFNLSCIVDTGYGLLHVVGRWGGGGGLKVVDG